MSSESWLLMLEALDKAEWIFTNSKDPPSVAMADSLRSKINQALGALKRVENENPATE